LPPPSSNNRNGCYFLSQWNAVATGKSQPNLISGEKFLDSLAAMRQGGAMIAVTRLLLLRLTRP
jgi:hypothetical protein